MSGRAEKPFCQTGPPWVCRRLKDKGALAPLTGQDSRALRAFLHLVELYGSSDQTGRHCAVLAMAACVGAMQPSTRHLAKAGIPHILDWSHEEEIWRQIENVAANTIKAVDRAAPDLLAAAKFARSVIHTNGVFETSERLAIEKLDAAIAKFEVPS